MVHLKSTLKTWPKTLFTSFRNVTLFFLTEATIIRHVTTVQTKTKNDKKKLLAMTYSTFQSHFFELVKHSDNTKNFK